MSKLLVGSVCSGIEAASVAWSDLCFEFAWFSETSLFPSEVLKSKYPKIQNLGDMCGIPEKLRKSEIYQPDLICGGTPCQAFSLAGLKNGLNDNRGNLTLNFVDIVNENDRIRKVCGLRPSIVLWENVEGVLSDKTNAFGCFLSYLSGRDSVLSHKIWPKAGVMYGKKRNIAWRVLDAKYFGLPQQRKRLYVIAGGKDFVPEQVLFEPYINNINTYTSDLLTFEKQGEHFEFFRSYTDCLYSAYGTKWNGNAAAYNGSLFVCQNNRLRRFTPLECERLMGFPDDYTKLGSAKPTNRYQSLGNSWSVPVIRWIGSRIEKYLTGEMVDIDLTYINKGIFIENGNKAHSVLTNFDQNVINFSESPSTPVIGSLKDIVSIEADERYYLTPVGCKGILRRKQERNIRINQRLEHILNRISSQWSDEKIEKISRRQPRGSFVKYAGRERCTLFEYN